MEGRTMSERISEADLRRYEFNADSPAYDLHDLTGKLTAHQSAVRDLVAEVRRLRGLIVRVLPPDGAPIHHEPSLLGAAELRGQIVRDLVAEAEAIRAESKGEPHA
jgi:hypothetical protein